MHLRPTPQGSKPKPATTRHTTPLSTSPNPLIRWVRGLLLLTLTNTGREAQPGDHPDWHPPDHRRSSRKASALYHNNTDPLAVLSRPCRSQNQPRAARIAHPTTNRSPTTPSNCHQHTHQPWPLRPPNTPTFPTSTNHRRQTPAWEVATRTATNNPYIPDGPHTRHNPNGFHPMGAFSMARQFKESRLTAYHTTVAQRTANHPREGHPMADHHKEDRLMEDHPMGDHLTAAHLTILDRASIHREDHLTADPLREDHPQEDHHTADHLTTTTLRLAAATATLSHLAPHPRHLLPTPPAQSITPPASNSQPSNSLTAKTPARYAPSFPL